MSSVRPFVAASVALVGASVIAVSPVTPAQPELRTVGLDRVNLVAATASDFCEGVVGRLCEAAASEQVFTPIAGAVVAAATNRDSGALRPAITDPAHHDDLKRPE